MAIDGAGTRASQAVTAVLCGIFFLSGAASLVFEALWFHLAGLALGNSVWAGAIVLATFMAGLAIGSGLAGLRGDAAGRPLRWYAALEGLVGVTGFGIVVLLPALTGALAPVFRSLEGRPLLVNGVRLAAAALLMLVPATAMGATLPLMVRALARTSRGFGRSLGVLYGWNTLGATTGVLAAEFLLIPRLGLRGAGLAAGLLSLTAAASAWAVPPGAGALPAAPAREAAAAPGGFSGRALRLLGAGFLCGLILLALEVLWFRFLALFFSTVSQNFAIMLAVALAGIGLGGLAASRRAVVEAAAAPVLAAGLLATGAAVALLYGNAGAVLDAAAQAPEAVRLFLAAGAIMLPVTGLSGALFALLGRALHEEGLEASRATGALGLANTAGGMLGSLLGGFALIPQLGLERSFFLLALLYGAGALLAWPPRGPAVSARVRRASWGLAAVFAAAVALFPFGTMAVRYLERTVARFESRNGERRVAYREGVSETIQYLEKSLLGRPYYHRLVTDSNSMSSTTLASQRYMKFFVYLPAALHPRLESALLICFGCGSTARALADTPDLRRIDVVDVSRDVLEMSEVVFPEPGRNPLRDPRVRLHVEDGRFYLQTTGRRYDLITAEPPPPRNSGIVNLYTREYFQLIRERLAEGGFVSYWLPVAELTLAETQAVLAAFGEVFPGYSVWTGAGYEWVMLGTRGEPRPASEAAFRRQWREPGTAADLRALGFPSPEEFGALFIADGSRLARWLEGRPPLVDDRPRRLSQSHGDPAPSLPAYDALMDPRAARENFLASPAIARLWPETLRRAAAAHFPARRALDELVDPRAARAGPRPERVRRYLTDPLLRPYRLWALESDRFAQEIVSRTRLAALSDPTDRAVALKHLAAGAVERGDLAAADAHYRQLVDLLGARRSDDDALTGELRARYAQYRRVLAELGAPPE